MLKISDNWGDANEAPFINIRLVPNRSLNSNGTKVVFALIACGFLLPIIPFLGSPIGTTLTIFSGLTFYLFLTFLQKTECAGSNCTHMLTATQEHVRKDMSKSMCKAM